MLKSSFTDFTFAMGSRSFLHTGSVKRTQCDGWNGTQEESLCQQSS